MKKYKILYEPNKNEYHIGFLLREWRGSKYWMCVEQRWKNLQQLDCNNIEDIVELTENDSLTYYL